MPKMKKHRMKALYLLRLALWLFTLEQAFLAHGRILERRPTVQFRNLKQTALAHGRIPAFAACMASDAPLFLHNPFLGFSGLSRITDNAATCLFSEYRLTVDTSSKPESCTVPDSISSFRIAFYNMENFFDCWHDSSKNDHDFTPAGIKGWGRAKYANKRNRLFKATAALDAECPLAAIGLAEVENARVLRELCRGTPLRYKGFDFVHFESPDPRGIDVALLYRKDLLQVDTAYPIALVIPPDSVARTRDILYVRATLKNNAACTKDASSVMGNSPVPSDAYPATRQRDDGHFTHPKPQLHLFVCHFPSKYGGTLETNHKRAAAARLLRQHMDSLYSKDSTAFILAMGDLNTTAEDSVLSPLRSPPYLNLMASHAWQPRFARHAIGSHKFREEWSTIDHIILNRHVLPRLKGGGAFVFARSFLLQTDERYMGIKPFRTFYGAKHLGGYSDHLPVYIDLHPPDIKPNPPQGGAGFLLAD